MGEWLKNAEVKGTFSWYINHYWDPYEGSDPDESYKKYIKKMEKKEKKRYLYLTLSPDKQLRNIDRNQDNLSALVEWCEKWFGQDVRHYGDYAWVIESGSKGDHLHIHAVCEIKNSHKHAERLKSFWARYFPNNQLLTSKNLGKKDNSRGEYTYLSFDDEQVLADKLLYFVNEAKGSHTNLIDEGLRGSRGFITDNI